MAFKRSCFMLVRCLLIVFSFSAAVCSKTTSNSNVSNLPVITDSFATNPLLASGPDPWVIQKDSFYYYTHTTGRNITIYKTSKISALSTATTTVAWVPPSTGLYSKNIWAPEIHFLQGKWYIYFAADDGDNKNHRL